MLTIFPEFIEAFLNCGIVKKAIDTKKIAVNKINIRDFSKNKHKTIDDKPYGGGAGMLMQAEPIISAIKYAKNIDYNNDAKCILLSPQGERFNNKLAESLSKEKKIIFICGRYEGLDERVSTYIDREISIGDFVLTGGEIATMAVMDSVIRFIPNVLGNSESLKKDSFAKELLKYNQYTRPFDVNGEKTPEVLISGDHKKIKNGVLKMP